MSVRRLLTLLLPALLAGACATSGDRGQTAEQRERAAVANTRLGVEYLQRGQHQQALRKLQKALRQDPDNSNAWMSAGIVYEELDEPDEAERHLRRAVELDDENARAQNNYARVLCRNGDIDGALALFDRAAGNSLYESPEVPLANAGLCALRVERREEAERYFQQALRDNPGHGTSLLQMAALHYDMGEYLAARGYYQRFDAVSSRTAFSTWLGLRIERALGDDDRVASHQMLLRNRFPDSEETREMQEWEEDGRL